MAIDIFSIPPMSDEPERVFSGARRTCTWDRAQLDVKTIENLEVLGNWVRNDLANVEYVLGDDDIVSAPRSSISDTV
jgi:hypothetical protein